MFKAHTLLIPFVALVVSLLPTFGCASSHRPSGEGTHRPNEEGTLHPSDEGTLCPGDEGTLRLKWAKEWTKQSTFMDICYTVWMEKEAPKRGMRFNGLLNAIDFWARDNRVQGGQVLDLIGNPDYWTPPPTGGVGLVYIYERSDRTKGACFMSFDATGKLSLVGWTSLDTIDFTRFRPFK
jgi:hypothetical protein